MVVVEKRIPYLTRLTWDVNIVSVRQKIHGLISMVHRGLGSSEGRYPFKCLSLGDSVNYYARGDAATFAGMPSAIKTVP